MQNVRSKSRYLIGHFYYKFRDNPDAALVFFNDAITVAPNSDFAAKAREMIDRIESGAPAPKSPLQWLLGRYDGPASRSYRLAEEEREAAKASATQPN